MGLMSCAACGYTVNDQAVACPGCGANPRTGVVPERAPAQAVVQNEKLARHVLALERERQKAHPQPFAFVHSFTPWPARLVATWIDMVLLFLPVWALVLLIPSTSVEAIAPSYLILLLGYFTFMEAIVGRTVGKMVFGSYVLRFDGGRIGLGRSIVRNLFKMLGLGGSPFTLLCIVSNKNRQRFGDACAGTIVVQDTPRQVQQSRARLRQATVSAPAGSDTTTK